MKRFLLLGAAALIATASAATAQSETANTDISGQGENAAHPVKLAAVAPAADQPQPPIMLAASATQMPETVLVFGRAEQQLGIADAASEGAIAGADLSVRPTLRVAELLEAVPGLIAAQHSGSGKANQYFLRGINLDHGTDFAAFIDDVPWNFRTHGHGQGYLDINGMIPEIVGRIDYRKGPYRADLGDFAMAGAALISTVDKFDRPFAQVEYGSFGYGRLVTGGTFDVGNGKLSLVGQAKIYDGPWELAEHLRHYAGWAKYVRETALGTFDASLSGYTATWRSTEQIPERAIGNTFSAPGEPTVACKNEFCVIDPTEDGLTTRWIATARIAGDAWHANVYAQFYNWHMSSNPTFFLEDPINGDQILQEDRRWIYGGKAEKQFNFNDQFQLRVGVEGRYDDISRVGVSHSAANVILNPISMNAVQEGSLAGYTEATYSPIYNLRLTAGLRGDVYMFDVKALNAVSLGGKASSDILSPKFGAAYSITDYLEFYGNWGQGFHSNDGRGVTTAGQQALVKGEGEEVGGRLQFGQFNFTATYWWLQSGSELVFVGDSNSVEPRGKSAREGLELVAFWRPFDWLAIDGVYTHTFARFLNAPGAEFIPGALEDAGELGISAIFPEYEASMRIRYHGPFPLIEDNSERQEGDMLINFRFAWKPEPFTISLELLNALDHEGKDIAYWYATRLPGEPAAGIEDRLSRAEEPRTIRVGVKYTY